MSPEELYGLDPKDSRIDKGAGLPSDEDWADTLRLRKAYYRQFLVRLLPPAPAPSPAPALTRPSCRAWMWMTKPKRARARSDSGIGIWLSLVE